jgi:HlyD family secretion protein
MDRELSESARQKKKRLRVIQIVSLCLAFLIILFSLRFIIKPSVKRSGIQTATVETGSIEASITASGIVIPEFEETKTSPVQSVIRELYRNAGDEVMEGDSILSLDTRLTLSSLEKLRDELNIKKNNIRQHELELEKNQIELRTRYEIKKLQVDNMATELEEEKYLNSIGGGTQEKIEKAELNLKISRLELEQIRQSIQNQEKTMQANLLGLKYEISIQQKNVNELQIKLDQSTIKVDKHGVITWINNQIGKNINPGDELVKIANLQSYEVTGSISDIHASQLGIGKQVIVRLNENTDLRGDIVNISPSVSGNNIKFNINLKNKNHALLRPNLRVDVFVITSYKDRVLRIKIGPFYKGGLKQTVFVVKGNELISRQVTFGGNNVDYVGIVNGLTQGEEMVISDMSDYERHKKLRIK